MPKKRNKPYIPSKKVNPVALSEKINRNSENIERIKLVYDMRYKALQDFVILLTNFASHDIKNAIHNMDGVVSTLDQTDVTAEDINNLKSCLDNIRSSLDDFTTLGLQKEKDHFELLRLMTSLEMLHRPNFNKEGIKYSVEYVNVDKDLNIHQVFQYILQLLNNLIINSTKALEKSSKKIIKVVITKHDESTLQVRICDTGEGIKAEHKDNIFKPYFTTTGGSGVGLTHVGYVLKEIEGTIKLIESTEDFVTIFEIRFPL